MSEGGKIALAALTIALIAGAQAALKKGAAFQFGQKEWILAIAAAAVMSIAVFFLQARLLRFYELSSINPILTIASTLLIAALGAFFFGESLTTKKLIGLALGAASLWALLSG